MPNSIDREVMNKNLALLREASKECKSDRERLAFYERVVSFLTVSVQQNKFSQAIVSAKLTLTLAKTA